MKLRLAPSRSPSAAPSHCCGAIARGVRLAAVGALVALALSGCGVFCGAAGGSGGGLAGACSTGMRF